MVITAYATFDTAVEAMRRGAWDYLPKPFTPAQIRHVVERFGERRRLSWKVADLEARLASAQPELELATESPRLRAVYETIGRAAAVDVPVLLRGETGTGKSLCARALHAGSRRAERPFVVVNCPTLSEELLASELFGHSRGAFTGAVRDQAGPGRGGPRRARCSSTRSGEIPPTLQAKLLRFLQDKEFERVGENRTRRSDARVVAATNRDLEADIRAGRFREDLFYRLNVIEVVIPPLRERREDILPLARRFLAFYARAFGRRAPALSPATDAAADPLPLAGQRARAAERHRARPHPVARRHHRARRLPRPDARRAPAAAGPQLGGDCTLADIEREHILRVVGRSTSLDAAAETLGIDASTLWRKRKKFEEGPRCEGPPASPSR